MVFPRATLAGVACLLVLLAVLVPGRADAQTRLDEYIVTGVEVDVTAQTAAAARDRAFLDGQRQALALLVAIVRQWAIEVLTDKAAAAGVRVDSLSIAARADVAMGAALAERTGGSAAVADDAGQLGNLLAIFAQRLTSTTADKAVAEAPRQLTPPSATLPRPAAALNGAADWRNPASPDPVVALESLPAPAAGPVTALAVAGEGVGGVVHGLSRGWSNNATWRALGYSIVLLILTAVSISYVWRRRVTAKSAIDVDHGGPRLIDIRGISGRRSYSLDHKMVRVSRAPAADTANVVTVHIPRDVISRAHAFIDWRDGAYWVTDPGSNNGASAGEAQSPSASAARTTPAWATTAMRPDRWPRSRNTGPARWKRSVKLSPPAGR